VPKDLWDGFEEVRKRRKKPLTDRARELVVAKLLTLRQNHDVRAVMEQSILHGWDSFYDLKPPDGKAGPPAKPASAEHWAFALAA